MSIEETQCCGVNEIDGLGGKTPKETVASICHSRYADSDKTPFYIFTGVWNKGYCQKFIKYIKDNKLGTILKSTQKVNPNTNNKIIVGILTVDDTKFRAWNKRHSEFIEKQFGQYDEEDNDEW
jgi:hypothetical protein